MLTTGRADQGQDGARVRRPVRLEARDGCWLRHDGRLGWRTRYRGWFRHHSIMPGVFVFMKRIAPLPRGSWEPGFAPASASRRERNAENEDKRGSHRCRCGRDRNAVGGRSPRQRLRVDVCRLMAAGICKHRRLAGPAVVSRAPRQVMLPCSDRQGMRRTELPRGCPIERVSGNVISDRGGTACDPASVPASRDAPVEAPSASGKTSGNRALDAPGCRSMPQTRSAGIVTVCRENGGGAAILALAP